jgi:hypothetical protein
MLRWLFSLKRSNKFYKLLKHSNPNCMTDWMASQTTSMIVFVVFKIQWITCMRDFLWRKSGMNKINKYMLGMIWRMIAMIGIWIVAISGKTTTFIFYLITLIHLP